MHAQINEIYAYLHGLWRYRWSSLLIAWIVGMLGWLVVYALPDQYEAKAVVHIDTSSIMKPLLKGLAVETDPAEQLMVMTRVLLSRENLLVVMRETDMDLAVDTPEEREEMVQELASKISLSSGSSRRGSGGQYLPNWLRVTFAGDGLQGCFHLTQYADRRYAELGSYRYRHGAGLPQRADCRVRETPG